jgi:uncharacterized membrane protein YhaH (DUF805 family)
MRSVFSFKGRASRLEFWVQTLTTMAIFAVSWIAIIAAVMRTLLRQTAQVTAAPISAGAEHHQLLVAALIMLLCFVFYAWAFLAVSARRLHDLGRHFSLASFDFGPSIACGFKRGMVGPNTFGHDPIGKIRD